MTRSMGAWRTMMLAAIVLCIIIAVTATGQGAKSPAGTTFATVDVQRVTREYKAMQVAQTELAARQAKANARIQRWLNMPYLSEDELKQLDDIEAKDPASRTAEETAKAKELSDKGMRLTAEIAALMQKSDKDLTDADKQRLRDAEAARSRIQQRVEQIRDQEDTNLRDFGMSNQDRLTQAFRASVKRVAEKRGVAIVFDAQVAIYAGIDVTDEVIKDLNSK